MTLKTLLYNIAQYAIGNKIINYSAAGPSLYGLNMETIKDYPVLFASPTGNHNITPNLTTYTITLYYIDRLTRGGDNDIDILSTSVEGLKSIINGIKYLPGVIEIYDDYNITNFADTQKMSDNVAGAYATITIRTANNSTCPDGGIISNGSFIPSDNIVVKNQNKNLIVNENGNYTLKPDNGYTGLGRVIVKVDVPDDNGSYEEGYEEGNKVGFEDGKRTQKELMQPITITSNGTYIRDDGYSEVVVDVDGDENRYDEGYQDGYNQGEEDQKSKLTGITITENGTYLKDDGYNEVIVNVPQTGGTTGSLALVDGTKLSQSTFTEVPDYYDFSNITDMYYMFRQCYYLQNIQLIDTSNVTNMFGMFEHCTSLQTIPYLNTSNVTNMCQMFYDCRSLISIPELNTSNVTNMSNMFLECVNLTTIPELNTSNVTNMSGMFGYCTKLTTIPELNTRNVTNMDTMFYYQPGGINQTLISLPKIYCDSCNSMKVYFGVALIPNLTDVGGWINLNINWNDDYGLAKCPNLTYQSCINILNGLADMTGTDGRTLKVHQNFLDTVGDEINIGINKNWTITA